MKQKEKDEAIFDEVNPNDEPQYNNFLIEGLKVETQYVNDQLKKQIQAFEIVPAKNVFDKRVTVRQPTKLNHEIQTMELSIKKDSKNQAM